MTKKKLSTAKPKPTRAEAPTTPQQPELTACFFPLEEPDRATEVILSSSIRDLSAQSHARLVAQRAASEIEDAMHDIICMTKVCRFLERRGLDCIEVQFLSGMSDVKPEALAEARLHFKLLTMVLGGDSSKEFQTAVRLHPVTLRLKLSRRRGKEGDEPPQAQLDFDALFRHFHAQIDEAEGPIVEVLSQALTAFEGHSFDDLELNRRFASDLQRLLNRLGLRIACPTCNKPSRMKCVPSVNAQHGVFQLSHMVDPKDPEIPTPSTATSRDDKKEKRRASTHGGATQIPRLILVPQPPDIRRK